MRFVMKQRLLSFGDDFAIKTDQGKDAYYVDGKVFSIGKKLSILDKHQREVAVLRKKLFTIRPTFIVVKKETNEVIAKIFKKMFTFRNAFCIDLPGRANIDVTGKLLEHEYRFTRNKKEVASVSKSYFRASDTYGIEVKNESLALVIICAAVAIDLMVHKGRDSSF